MWNQPTTEQLNRIIPANLYESEHIALYEKIIYAHFFISSADWFIAEYDRNDLLFGFCSLGDVTNAEWGYVSFNELMAIKVAGWLEVDFDLYWEPKPASDVEIIKRAMAQGRKCYV